MDAAEGDIKQVKQGMNYLVQQLASPPPDPPKRRIGFGTNAAKTRAPTARSRK
jgi:hypothetical protein